MYLFIFNLGFIFIVMAIILVKKILYSLTSLLRTGYVKPSQGEALNHKVLNKFKVYHII